LDVQAPTATVGGFVFAQSIARETFVLGRRDLLLLFRRVCGCFSVNCVSWVSLSPFPFAGNSENQAWRASLDVGGVLDGDLYARKLL
jgi:hypothetical protein